MDLKIDRLAHALNSSRHALRRFRENRVRLVKEFVGSRYSEQGCEHDVPVNFIAQYVGIVVRNLIAQNPRVMLSTFDPSMKVLVATMQDWANKEIERMRLEATLKRGTFDALFSVGIVKVALATPADSANSAWTTGAGKPFAERVDLDDFAFDMHARDFREASFLANRIRVQLDAIKDDPNYDREQTAKLAPSRDSPYNQQGDERVKQIGQSYAGVTLEEYDDMVDLWEVYLPRRRLVVTLTDDDVVGASAGAKPLRVQKWIGPDCGPYHFLGLSTVPGNAMPKSPLMDLLELHRAANNMYRKLLRQCERMKELTVCRKGSNDLEKLREANDGELVGLDNPEMVKVITQGGPNQVLAVFHESLRNLFSWFAGNLDSLGGLSPQAKTATQDSMLERNSSKGIADYQDRVISWTAEILDSLCWYWYHDPQTQMRSVYKIPGTSGVTLPKTPVTPQQRMFDPTTGQPRKYEDIDVAVDPYSIQHSTPQQRLAMINGFVQNVYAPLAQILGPQGVALDGNTLLDLNSKYGNIPEMSELFHYVEPAQPDSGSSGGGDDGGVQPAQTQRTYVRENRSGRTAQGDTVTQMQALRGQDAGGAPKPTQQQAMGGMGA